MSILFSPIVIRGTKIKNRCWVSPMCQYSSKEGLANDWHLVHLGTRAVGGAGLVMTEAAAVSLEGRISPSDLGIWDHKHIEPLKKITNFLMAHDAIPAIQIAHSGRKGSTKKPWENFKNSIDVDEGGWIPIGPSAIPFDGNSVTPNEMSLEDIDRIISCFSNAALRSEEAGFKCIEVHMAHGYLVHEFLSPVSNKRKDEYGGDLYGRMNFALKIVTAIREVISDNTILFIRISATDYLNDGWDLSQSIVLCKEMKKLGVDLIDCSSGGSSPKQKLDPYPGYQVPFASQIKNEAKIMTGSVGLITQSQQAEDILNSEHSDAVFIGRELLRNPYFPLQAQIELDKEKDLPNQYERAF